MTAILARPAAPSSFPPDWRHRASCREEDPELFFPVGESGSALLQIAEAKTVCRRCPVRSECLTWALENGEDDGVWGGMSEAERRALSRRNAAARRGAQRKCARAGCEEPLPPPKGRGRPAQYCGYACQRAVVHEAVRERERSRRRGEAT